jgi:hypothetical protein
MLQHPIRLGGALHRRQLRVMIKVKRRPLTGALFLSALFVVVPAMAAVSEKSLVTKPEMVPQGAGQDLPHSSSLSF